MKDEAILLRGDGGVPLENNNAAKEDTRLGVIWPTLTLAEFLSDDRTATAGASKSRLFCSSEGFSRLIEELEASADTIRLWQERVHSAFVYAGEDSAVLQKLVRRITADDEASLRQMNGDAGERVVSNDLAEFCGVMSGLRLHAAATAFKARPDFDASHGNITPLRLPDRASTFVNI